MTSAFFAHDTLTVGLARRQPGSLVKVANYNPKEEIGDVKMRYAHRN